MIPMTVSFFLKQSAKGDKKKGRINALMYGFFIVFIYVLISLPFHIFQSLSPDIFYEISTNPYLNIFFFTIFLVFAISFLGAFEITMPSALANKVDNASNKGGFAGIFFMALTLIIVSFSCTGPALGAVIGGVLSTDGGAKLLTIAMFGFGLGLAFPFMIFALFPSMMGSLPKSGGWLNTVKVVFGFIELALAFKFLSMADLVMDWHLLERETFIAVWIAIFGGLALYLFGKITLPHDSPLPHISVGRLLLGLLSLTFTIYLIPGLWGAPLNLISGFPPPMSYSESPQGVGFKNSQITISDNNTNLPEHASYGPHNIITFHNYDDGLAYAKKVNKPVMIDFTGVTCVNCRRMEEKVWSKPEILSILKEEVVMISLYVDDRTPLPKDDIYENENGKEIDTYGKKWSDFAITKYKANIQPYYILMGHNEENLNKPVGYTPDIELYEKWLKEGISKFKK
jgi:thiol:disulfide interchange protein DsbD